MNLQLFAAIFFLTIFPLHLAPAENIGKDEALRYWGQWRGPLGTGVAPKADPPIEWSETKNIRWKISLPGRGHSTPVIWGERVFLTTAVPYGDEFKPIPVNSKGAHDLVPVKHRYKFIVLAVNRRDGKILWQKTVREDLPHEGGHITASLASASTVTDGKLLFAYFGSWGLYCLDLDGNLKWQTDFGTMRPLHAHGEGSSPALYRDTIVVNWDHEGPSFLVALDRRTGKERWKVERERVSSWTTPIIVEQDGKPQVIVSGSKKIRGYDLANGKVIWECKGLSVENVCATPVIGRGIVYAGSSYDNRGVLAIRYEGAEGDITGTKRVVWTRQRGTPYVPSFLLYDDALYFHYHFKGVLSRVDAISGEERPGIFRLNGIREVFASPIGAAGRVYIADLSGSTIVLSNEAKPEVLALNHLDDSFGASPAAVANELYLRGAKHLYCIAKD